MNQDSFRFDAPLTTVPATQLRNVEHLRPHDALIGGQWPEFQAYKIGNDIRYRRLPPLMPCPGYSGFDCDKPTRGGVLCAEHAKWEEEDLEMGEA